MWAIKLSISSLFNKLEFAASSNQTGSSGCNESAFLTSWGVSSHSSWVTNVLMISSSMRMFDGVHSNTSDSGPVLLLRLCFVVGNISLQEGLIGSLTTSDDADHGSAGSLDGFSESRWESHSGSLSVFGVTDDDSGAAGRASDTASISEFGLNVGDDGALGHCVHGKDVSDGEGCY